MQFNPLAQYRDRFIDPATGQLDLNAVIDMVIATVLERDQTLDLSRLQRVRYNTDYPTLIATIAKEVGQQLIPTDRRDGKGMAMAIHGSAGDILALHTGLLHSVFGPDGDLVECAIWTVHHELSNIHDWTVKTRNIGVEVYEQPHIGLSQMMFPFAELLWSEYFAERRSYPSVPGGNNEYADMLVAHLPVAANAVKKALVAIALSNDVLRLLHNIRADVKHLFLLIAYILGDTAGSGSPLAKDYPAVSAAIAGSYLEQAWPALAAYLDNMYATHGNWLSVDIYRPLEDAVQSVFARLGLVFSMLENGRVHLRPDFSVLGR